MLRESHAHEPFLFEQLCPRGLQHQGQNKFDPNGTRETPPIRMCWDETGVAPTALRHVGGFYTPPLPGWADVWRSALRASLTKKPLHPVGRRHQLLSGPQLDTRVAENPCESAGKFSGPCLLVFRLPVP
jgi:hypothetical protein